MGGAIASGITQSTSYSTAGILNTIVSAQIETATANQVIKGLRITSSILGAENPAAASINSLYYQDGTGIKVKMNIEYPDGTSVPITDGADIDAINNMLKEYEKYCANIAA